MSQTTSGNGELRGRSKRGSWSGPRGILFEVTDARGIITRLPPVPREYRRRSCRGCGSRVREGGSHFGGGEGGGAQEP